MPERRNPALPLLRAHDRELRRVEMPVGARNRVAAALAEEASRRSLARIRRPFLPMATFAAGAALVMLVLGWNATRSRTSTPVPSSKPALTIAGYTLQGEGCGGQSDGDAVLLTGRCRAVSATLSVETWGEARLALEDRRVTVLQGEAMFEVEKVPAGEVPFRVLVSHGVIEVVGTRFTVDQDEAGGTVDLFEGRIRFHDAAGEQPPVDIAPGDRYAWGDRVSVVAQTHALAIVEVPDAPQIVVGERESPPRVGGSPAPDAASLIERVAKLRAAGQYSRAAAVLRKALRRQWDARTGQVLSYELGQILERHLDDATAACEHWRRHQSKYPQGRYAGPVAASMRACPQ